MLDIWKNSNTTCIALADTYISSIRTIFFGVVSIAQLVEVTDSAVLGGVVEVVGSISAVGHKIFFSIFQHSYLLYLSISIFIINLYQYLILCRSKVLYL